MNAKSVVVLGAGVGGLIAAAELRRRLGDEHKIIVVEREPTHVFSPSLLWLMTGQRSTEEVSRPVQELLPRGVELIIGDVSAVDPKARRVEVASRQIAFDFLLIALGAELAPGAIPGLAESAHSYYSLDDTVRLRDALTKFNGGTLAVLVSTLPYKCPGAPHEGAMLLADFFRRRGIRDKVDLHLFTPEPQPMPVAGPALGAAVLDMLSERGIKFHPLHKTVSIDPTAREIRFDGKEPFRFDMLVAIPPHRGPRVAREAGIANEAGWIPVDPRTLKTAQDGVYAIGDAAAIPIPGRWKADVPMMLPKAGVFAHEQAVAVAARIAAEIRGAQPTATFNGFGYCMLEAGAGEAGFAAGDFFAEPNPRIDLRRMSKTWHLGKVLIEKWWLTSPGFSRTAWHGLLKIGGRVFGLPVP